MNSDNIFVSDSNSSWSSKPIKIKSRLPNFSHAPDLVLKFIIMELREQLANYELKQHLLLDEISSFIVRTRNLILCKSSNHFVDSFSSICMMCRKEMCHRCLLDHGCFEKFGDACFDNANDAPQPLGDFIPPRAHFMPDEDGYELVLDVADNNNEDDEPPMKFTKRKRETLKHFYEPLKKI